MPPARWGAILASADAAGQAGTWLREAATSFLHAAFVLRGGLNHDKPRRKPLAAAPVRQKSPGLATVAAIVADADTGETILEIEVHGKRGVGYCKSIPGAVRPFLRLKERNNPQPTDRLFPRGPAAQEG